MKKKLKFTYGLMLAITVLAVFVSEFALVSQAVMLFIMGLFLIKFLLVAFQFMELKMANSFWKGSIVFFLSLMILIIGFLL